MKQCSRLQFSQKRKWTWPSLTGVTNLRHQTSFILVVLWVLILSSDYGQAQDLDANTPSPENADTKRLPIHINGVFPKLTVMGKSFFRHLMPFQ